MRKCRACQAISPSVNYPLPGILVKMLLQKSNYASIGTKDKVLFQYLGFTAVEARRTNGKSKSKNHGHGTGNILGQDEHTLHTVIRYSNMQVQYNYCPYRCISFDMDIHIPSSDISSLVRNRSAPLPPILIPSRLPPEMLFPRSTYHASGTIQYSHVHTVHTLATHRCCKSPDNSPTPSAKS